MMRWLLGSFLLGLFLAASAANAALHDMVEMSVTGNPGTASFALNAAVSPYVAFATALTSGETVSYHAQDNAGNWENGRGVWTSGGGGGTLTRATILTSSNANAIVNFSVTSPNVFITAASADMVTTNYPNTLLSPDAAPPCALTDAAIVSWSAVGCSVPTNGVLEQTLTLTSGVGANRIIPVPTGGSAPASGQDIIFWLTQGVSGGPFTISLGSGFLTPSGLQPSLSAAAGAVDKLHCTFLSTSAGYCDPVVQNFVPVPLYTIYASTPGTSTFCTGPVASCASASIAVVNGSTLIAIPSECFGGAGGCGSGAAPTSITGMTNTGGVLGTCTHASASSFGTTGGGAGTLGFGVDVWLCPVTGTGTATVTPTWSNSTGMFLTTTLIDVVGIAASSPVDQARALVWATGAGVNASIATSGATTQANEFVLGFFGSADNSQFPITAGTGYTQISQDHSSTSENIMDEYSGLNTAGTQTVTFTLAANPIQNAMMSVLTLKHP